MNNSKIALDSILEEKTVDRRPWLEGRLSDLTKEIEAISRVSSSRDWDTLKSHIFDGVVENLERDLKNEAQRDSPDNQKLARINGQLLWARKYSSLDSLGDILRLELQNIKKQLKTYGKQEDSGDGGTYSPAT